MPSWTCIQDGANEALIDLDRVEVIYQQGENAVFVMTSGREVVSQNPKWADVLGLLKKLAAVAGGRVL